MWRTNNRYTLETKSAVGAFNVLNSAGTSTSENMVKTGAFRNQWITVITTAFSGTINFSASNATETWSIPDIDSAADTNNEHSVVQSIDLQSGATIDGNTWIVLVADTSVTRYEVNDNNTNFIGAAISAYTSGSVEIKIDLTDNQ